MWIPPEEKDPVLEHFPGRKSVGYFGAVRIRDGKFLYQREEQVFDGTTYLAFLKRLRSCSCHAGRKVILLVDNAKYHHARIHKRWRQERDSTFHCEFLPPYSPDLNPIERVWKLTRRLCIHNNYFPSIASIAESVEVRFDDWTKPNETLKRLCKL